MSTSTVVSSGSTVSVTSGVTSSGVLIQSGGVLDVLAGGLSVSATVQGQLVLSGGTDSASVVSSGGAQTVAAGGTGVGETVSAGGRVVVASGGRVIGDTVSGGSLTVSGGTASGTLLKAGTITLSSGTLSATTVASGASLTIFGGTSIGEVVSGGSETVESFFFGQGVAPVVSNGLIEAGGTQYVFSAATVAETIGSGGTQTVTAGTASGTIVSSGGFQQLTSTSTAVNDSVLSGGLVSAAGTLLFTETAGSAAVLGGTLIGSATVTNAGGGTLVLSAATVSSSFFAQGTFNGTVLVDGGTVELTSAGAAGTAAVSFVDGTSGTLRLDGAVAPANAITGLVAGDAIDLGGLAYNGAETVAVSGTTVTVTSGTGHYALTLSDAANDGTFSLQQAVDGSTLLIDTRTLSVVSSGATVSVASGVTSSGLAVLSGGVLDVLSGGTSIAAVLGQAFLSGGRGSATIVSSGGAETVSAGGVGVQETILGNGSETVSSGGLISGAVISGGTVTVSSGGLASGTLVKGGGLTVNGGTASATTVAAGASLTVSAGTTVGDILSGGSETVQNYNFGSATTIVSNGVAEAFSNQTIYGGGTAVNETVLTTASQTLFNGTASGTTISSGGSQTIYNGSAVNDTVLNGATVNDNGTLLFTPAAGNTVVLGGTVTGAGAIVNSGAGTLVLNAAVTSQSPFNSGFTGAVSIAGGTVELTSAGAAGTGSIAFLAGNAATLRIDGTATPTNSIAGLLAGDAIDLGGVAYSAAETVVVSGSQVLVVSSNATFALNLPDASNDGTFSLKAAADGSTLLIDTRASTNVASGATLTITSGVTSSNLNVQSGGALVVLSGGTSISASVEGQAVLSGGTGSGTIVNSGGTETISAGGIARADVLSTGGSATVSAGGTAVGDIVAGGSLIISSGTAYSTTVRAGSLVLSGGTESAGTIGAGGGESVYAGTAIGDLLSGGFQAVENIGFGPVPTSAVASNTTIVAGGLQEITFAGSAVSATVGSGGTQLVISGTAFATTVLGSGSQTLSAGAVAVNDVVQAGGTVVDGGTLQFTESAGATVSVNGNLGGNGTVVNSGGGTLVLAAAVTSQNFTNSGFTGTVSIAGGTVELTSAGAAGTGSIGFAAGSTGTLRIDGATTPSNTVSGLLQGDVIDLAGVAFSAGETVALASGNILQVTSTGGPTEQIQLSPSQSFAGEYFHLANDGAGGTAITNDTTACYAAGTRIATAGGDRLVEDLVAGDHVGTASGTRVPISWIGRRRVDLVRNPAASPVCIGAGVFGAGLPHRDLLVSPEHAVYADGVLIPARHLVGCAGIVVQTALPATTYFHIELPRHDVLLAEGLPCESWLDTGNRAMFENAPIPALHFTEQPGPVDATPYAPLVTGGPVLEALRQRLGTPRVQTIGITVAGQHNAELAEGIDTVRLVVPARQVPGDARMLGAAVTALAIDRNPIGLADTRLLAGFHAAEAGWRWTEGTAYVAVGAGAAGRVFTVDVSAMAEGEAAA